MDTTQNKYNYLLICIPLITFVCLFFAPAMLSAQDQTNQQNPVIQPIPTADILKETENMTTRLQKISNLLPLDENVNEISSKLPDYLKIYAQSQRDFDALDLTTISRREINDIAQQFQVFKNNFTNWQETLQIRLESLERERIRLQSMRSIWEATKTAAREEKPPKSLIMKIDSNLESIENIENDLLKRMNEVITIQNKISDQENNIALTLSALSEIETQRQSEIFSMDAEPIWVIFDTDTLISEQFSALFVIHSENVNDFIDNYRHIFIYHLAFFILVYFLLIMLHRYDKKLIVDKDTSDRARVILRNPFSVALIISLLATTYIYPQAPNVIYKIIWFIGLLLAVRLLPKLVEIHHEIYVFAGVFSLFLFISISPEDIYLYRVLLLVLAVLNGIFIVWIIRSSLSLIVKRKKKWERTATFLLRIVIFLMIVSVFANVVGNVSLAELLVRGSLNSMFGATIFLTGALVLSGILNLFISTRFASISRILRIHANKTQAIITRIIFSFAFIIWVIRTLQSFEVYSFLKDGLLLILSKRLEVGDVDVSLSDILIFVTAIWLSYIISRLIRFIMEEDILIRMQLPRGIPAAISMLTNYFILGIGFMIALSAAGFDMSQISIIIGALGVGIGFGLQNIVNNFISGLILIFERPVQVGDVVEVENLLGEVKRIGIRSSTIRTYSGAEAIVPNANLISNQVINWTLSDRLRRIEIDIGVAYGSSPGDVLKLLLNTTSANPGVLKDPPPMALFQEFGESSLNFNVRFWTSNLDTFLSLKSEITLQIHDALKEAGIEIPFPQHDLHLRSVDSEILKRTISGIDHPGPESGNK
ncbi:MAG: mechanosensitive ion channel [Calditrichales bacterium]|nr:MAG: mechanosensitive ion channel [Calditrichales bacterium]